MMLARLLTRLAPVVSLMTVAVTAAGQPAQLTLEGPSELVVGGGDHA